MNHMKKILYTFILLFITYSGYAQVMGNSQYNDGYSKHNNPVSGNLEPKDNEILIKVNGLMNIVADSYVAVFNLIQIGETMDDVDKEMNNRINMFCENLNSIGVTCDDITVDLVSVVPKYDIQTESKLFSKSYNEKPAGFEMQKSILIHYKKASQLDAIMSTALKAEIYDFVKSDYYTRDISQAYDSLRVACMKELNRKIKTYEMTGIKFEPMKKTIVDDNITILPPIRYSTYQAFARPSFNSINKKYAYNEVDKSVSRYYNPVSYSAYDVVLNPVITEPVVQISYSLVVKYTYPEDKSAEKVYYILTPTGEAKQLILK